MASGADLIIRIMGDSSSAIQSFLGLRQESQASMTTLAKAVQGATTQLTGNTTAVKEALSGMFDEVNADRLISQLQEGGQAGEAAAQEIIQSLNSIQSETDRTAAGLSIFGDAWREVEQRAGQAADSINTSLADVSRRADTEAGQMRQALSGIFDDVTADRLVRELASGGQAGQDAAREISRALVNVNSDVDRARAGVAVFGNSWNGVEQEARQALQHTQAELQDTNTEVDRVRSGLAALATGAAGIKLSGDIDAVTASAGHLRAMLGLTKEESLEFEKVARDVYSAGLGEDLREATSAVAQVNQVLDLTGEELKTQTENVLLLNKTFEELGADTQTSLNAAKVMTESWGISSQEAFDIITVGFQSGAGRSGDLLDTLTEYPSHFKALGLTAKDSLSWLSIGMENGAMNTDKLADAFKEFGIRVKTDGDTAQLAIQNMFPPEEAQRLIADFAAGGEGGRDAFYQVFQALSQVQDPAERYNTAIQLMGTQAEDLTADTLLPMIDAFVKQKDAQLETEGATKTLGEELSGLNATLEQSTRTLEMSTIGPLGDFGSALQGVIQGVSGVGMGLLGLQGLGIDTSNVVGRLGTAATTAGGFIRTGFGGALTFLLGPGAPIALVVLAVAGLAFAAYEIIKHWEPIKQFFSDSWSGIKLIFTDAKTAVLGTAGELVDGAKDKLRDLWDWIKSLPSKAWGWGADIVQSMIDGITSLHIPLPHVSVSKAWSNIGGVNIPYPNFDLDWYGDGGIFNRPAIVGVGERGTEAVLPIEKLKSYISEAMAIGSSRSTVDHTGIITVKGVNSQNETMAVVDIVMSQLRAEARV